MMIRVYYFYDNNWWKTVLKWIYCTSRNLFISSCRVHGDDDWLIDRARSLWWCIFEILRRLLYRTSPFSSECLSYPLEMTIPWKKEMFLNNPFQYFLKNLRLVFSALPLTSISMYPCLQHSRILHLCSGRVSKSFLARNVPLSLPYHEY